MVASDQTKLSVSTILNASMSVQLVQNWLLTIPFYEIKSCCVVPSSYIKMKRRILQAWSLKYSIKKCMFPVVGEIILVASGSPLPSSFLRWSCHFLTIDLFLFFLYYFASQPLIHQISHGSHCVQSYLTSSQPLISLSVFV